MAKRRGDDPPGYGKLLDAWVAPEDAGDAIGCLATTFTFSPAFFEEECLARFLQLESDPAEDGPVYLVEREEKLAQLSCAAVLVDQHHCRGPRSLRWDLISARLLRGLQHAKVSLLYWDRVCRVIIGSANLTEDGYRRNLEVYGVVDFRPEGDAPVSCLSEVLAFLRRLGESGAVGNAQTRPLQRWNQLLDRVPRECLTWGTTDLERKTAGVHLQTVFSGPGYPSVFDSLRQAWPGGSPPDQASVVSPFFDPPEAVNAPARALWTLLRRRGEATAGYFVTGEDVPGEDQLFLHAPESLLRAEPAGRPGVRTDIFRVTLRENRPLHAKGMRLEDGRWTMYQIGSSNFTSSGTGLSHAPNFEANLVYTIDSHREPAAHKALRDSFPEGTLVELDADVL